MISAIAAMSKNRVIGKDNGLPWHIPEDLAFFKNKTRGSIIIMGRKTFDSIQKPLPKRLNVVVTRDKNFKAEGVVVFNSVEAAIEHAKNLVQNKAWPNEIFIVGGAEIYRLALPYTDRIYLTEIHAHVEGDTLFPEISSQDFRESERIAHNGSPAFDFVTYDRADKVR